MRSSMTLKKNIELSQIWQCQQKVKNWRLHKSRINGWAAVLDEDEGKHFYVSGFLLL